MGIKDNVELSGVVPRSSALIFQQIADRPQGWKFEIEVSYLEIYMERVNDLLNPDKQNLNIKEARDRGVFVDGLTREENICGIEDIYDIIDRGDKIRKVAATKMNAGSSRSHSVLSIYLSQTSPEGVKMLSQLNMVDLAGSERLSKTEATGETMKQGTLINLSLTILAQVIQALSLQSGGKTGGVIPFRSSKLTRLLQTSLGGNAKTGLSIHCSPHMDNLEESVSTFEFGKRAKMIKNNAKAKVQRSAEQLEAELEKLQAAFDKLKELYTQLSKGKPPPDLLGGGGGGGAVSSAELEEERQKVAELEQEAELTKKENDDLKAEIQTFEETLQAKTTEVEELKKDFEVKDLEVRALQMKLRELGGGDDDVDFGGDDDSALADTGVLTSTVAGFKATNPSQNAALAELNNLVNKQKEMLGRVRLENKELKKENLELTDELEEKTRRLALAELQVMRYENARNRLKDGKIKVKISSGNKKPSPVWRNLLDGPTTTGNEGKKIDYERRRRGTILERFGGLHPIPSEELNGGREGPLEERLYQKTKFVRRWFVLRDSFLFCYETEESSRIEPRFCIPLAESKIGSCPKQVDHEYCFMVLCGTYFNVMASQTDSEKTVWLKDLNYAKFVTHENLANLAHFNRLSIRAIPDAAEQEKTRAHFEQAEYGRLGETEYVHEVPGGGGMEGFLTCPGLKIMESSRTSRSAMYSKDLRAQWKSLYFVLKDSHLLIYDLLDHSDLITEPKTVLYMGGNVRVVQQHDESENPDDENDTTPVRFYFSVVNMDNEAEAVAVYANTDAERTRWMNALKASALVTTRNVLMAAVDKETITVKADISATEYDLQGTLLDPMCVQPYDDAQKPLYRHPDGRLVTRDLQPVDMDAKRFSKGGQPLDPYHRPLPPNAVAMFAQKPKEPIGVGVDGKHYAYPSGREFTASDPHYDYEGQKIAEDTVKAAEQIVPALKTACLVRSAILTREKHPLFDAFGRRIRKTRDHKLMTAEGLELGPNAAVFDAMGSRTKYKPPETGAVKTLEVIYLTNDATPVTLGKLGIEVGRTTLADVHAEVKKGLGSNKVSTIVFLVKNMPIPDKERELRTASDYLPRIVVSCRDGHGKRMVFDGKPFVGDVNHSEIEESLSKERESEFVKSVNSQKHRKSVVVSSGRRDSVLTTPRYETPRM